ncbi:hypothetical protein V3C99_016172 [Haemonchus contortus]|uniref:Multiple coagulation factor deficiency protein 2 homolog n=1 Tax=Haemonchus contortus TaxID=6289 RepID=A0A7I4YY26_HAECO
MVVYTVTVFACLICVFLVNGDREFAGNEEVHDESHIKKHLEDKIDVSKMTEDQQRFHYFSMSDLNKDNYIDGNEVLKALTHDHEGNTGPGIPVQDEDAIITMIDAVMKQMDVNGDGYVDFAEYMKDQTKKSPRSS